MTEHKAQDDLQLCQNDAGQWVVTLNGKTSHPFADEQSAKAAYSELAEERQPCEVWTRVMGYHMPKSHFNKGKQAEFAERKNFKEPKKG